MKRKPRTITACTECTRRKKKCNRQKPCNECVVRNVPGRCVYKVTPASDDFEESTRDDQTKPPPEDILDPPPTLVYTDMGEQLGYSSTGFNNASISINQLLGKCDLGNITTPSTTMRIGHPSWTQYWKLASQLPPPRVINNLVRLYFTTIQWQYCILESYYFNHLLQQWLSIHQNTVTELEQDLLCFPSLLFQVLAIALRFAPPDAYATTGNEKIHETTCVNLSRYYSDVGVNMINLLGENGRGVTAVEQHFVRAWWLKNSGRKADAWHSLGIAIRLAQTLDLHKQPPTPTSLGAFWENEYKRRLWANLFIWDSGMSFLLGRPCMIHRSDCNTSRPLNCDIPTDPLTTSPDELLAQNLPFSFAERLLQYDMACKIHDVRDFGLDRVSSETYVLVQEMQNQLESLMTDLPLFLRPQDPDTSFDELYLYLPFQRESVLTSISSAVYALHRPYLTSHEESRRVVLSYTMSALESQQRVFANTPKHHHGMFTLSFYTIDAALLLMTTAATYPPSAKESVQHIRQVLRTAMENLSTMANVNAIAGTGLALLNRCFLQMNSVLGSSIDYIHSSNYRHASGPMSQGMAQNQAAVLESDFWPADQVDPGLDLDFADILDELDWGNLAESDFSLFPPTV